MGLKGLMLFLKEHTGGYLKYPMYPQKERIHFLPKKVLVLVSPLKRYK
jgi:hypothetical protein